MRPRVGILLPVAAHRPGSSRAESIISGRIATLDGEVGFGWVEAIAIEAGGIVAAGRLADVEQLAGRRTTRITLDPAEVALPALTDAHLHLVTAALEARELDLTTAPTLAAGLEVIGVAHAALRPQTAWLTGHGWTTERWAGWPTAADLESVAKGRAVALWAHDHHTLWVSEPALKAAGIGPGTPDPPGGLIRRDSAGRPTGLLHENATRLVTARIPRPSATAVAEAIEAFATKLVALGVVGVHDPGGLSPDEGIGRVITAYEQLAVRGGLPLHVHGAIRPESLEAAIEHGYRSGDRLGDDPGGDIRFGWLKAFADGTLGSRTAALLEPWEPGSTGPDDPELGMFTTEPAELAALVARATAAGISTQIHAIGDAAVRVALDILGPTSGRTALQPRIEHVQLVHPSDVTRFNRLGVAASVQPIHLRSDAVGARTAWGKRAERSSYVWGSLAAAGATMPFGTDAPVESIDPWPGLAMAVGRWHPSWGGRRPFGRAERLPVDRALRSACVDGPASAAETDRGRLISGQRADLVVIPAAALDDDGAPDGPLATARPRLVLVGGRPAYEA
jgi:predicted amidohydrolase YtcJ